MKKVLIINDFVSYGKMAGRMMDAILSYKNYDVFFIPTALIANNFSYGKNAFLDPTSYLEDTLKNWQDLGFTYDLIFIGYIANKDQRDILISFINSLEKKPFIFVDPIMGDNGSLYTGLSDDIIDNYRSLISLADLISPNATEAKLLDMDLKNASKSYLITSKNEGDSYFVEGYDKDIFRVYFEKLPSNLAGTGDMFDGFIILNLLKGLSLKEACERSVKVISKIYKLNMDQGSNQSINIEKYLNLID
ncbi:MAG: bifunctional hydroxymethylpyrimidine kinase/phosphomethylpyrimidine kinase [Anaerococcus sp.]|nr:bifunctional hydroxymethylpyrimidine kinase/phosphomethylpyrimidine kinase [Anaerococcus sp.]